MNLLAPGSMSECIRRADRNRFTTTNKARNQWVMKFSLIKLYSNNVFPRCALFVLVKVSISMIVAVSALNMASAAAKEGKTHHTLLSGGGLAICTSASRQFCTEDPFSDEYKSQSLFSITAKNREKFTKLDAFLQLPQQQKQHLISGLDRADSHLKANSKLMTWETFSGLFNPTDNSPTTESSSESAPVSSSEISSETQFETNSAFVAGLDDPIYFALRDSFEVPQLNASGKRKRVGVSLQHNQNRAMEKIYREFTLRAGGLAAKRQHSEKSSEKPLIAVVTASARDPFEEVDFFLEVFRVSGAEVIWLPLDPAFQVARDLERKYRIGCDSLAQIHQQFNLYYRNEVYPELVSKQLDFCRHPEKMHRILEQVDGVFFNEGDQSVTLNALLTPQLDPSPELAVIQRRHEAGELIVGGTGAGMVAMAGGDAFGRPVPMVSNGASEQAMERGAFGTPPPSMRCITANNCRPGIQPNDLTYWAAGGTGMFQLGLLDANFSEQNRETRLAVFTATARQRLAFGVDEGTAMVTYREAGETHIEVLGENGVFVLDFESGQATKRNKAIRRKPTPEAQLARSDRTFVEVAATAHYLSTGSEAIFSELHENFRFNLAGSLAQRKHELPPLNKGNWRDFTRKHCGSKERIYWQQYNNHYQLLPEVETQYYVSALRVTNQRISSKTVRQHCSYIHLPFVISYMSL